MPALPRWIYAGLALAALFAGPAAADNPRVMLTPGAYTAEEAVEALSKAAGLPLQLNIPNVREGMELPEPFRSLRTEKKQLDWGATTFGKALRLLGEKYRLRPFRSFSGGYSLSVGDPPLPPVAAPRVQAGGVQFSLLQLTVSNNLVLDFPANPAANPAPRETRLQVRMEAELGDGDAESILGLDNLTAKDDQGNVMSSDPVVFGRGLLQMGAYPDVWSGIGSLNGPHPRATKLLWLEGTLMGYPPQPPASVTLDLPAGKPFKAVKVGGVTLEAVDARSLGQPGADELPISVQLQMRITKAADPGAAIETPNFRVSVIGESGRRYSPGGSSSTGNGRDGMMTWSLNYTFGQIQERVVKVILEVKERGTPRPIARFRFRNLPLPREGIFVARARPARPNLPGAPGGGGPERPFQQAGGGTLVSPVLILGKPAPVGKLFLGLSAREGEEWGPNRWVELEIGADGRATLNELQPGTYRVLRNYRPSDVPSLPGPGVWRGGEAEVRVEAGKTVTLPPLAWERDGVPPAPVKPAAKPAAKTAKPAPKK